MKFLLALFLLFTPLLGKMNFWPEVFSIPNLESKKDNNRTQIISNQDLDTEFGKYRTYNVVNMLRGDSLKQFTQLYKYTLEAFHFVTKGRGDTLKQKQLEQKHSLDLSGSLIWHKYPFDFSSIGIKWSPNLVFNRYFSSTDSLEHPEIRSNDTSEGMASLHLGPLMYFYYLDMPIKISAGGAVDVWNNTMSYPPHMTDLKKVNSDPGFFGEIEVGDNTVPLIRGIPFYVEGSIFGQYMQSDNNAKITSGEINALYFQDLPFADTLFVYCADTVTKGRTAFFSGNAPQLISTPNRTRNSLQVSVGLDNIGHFSYKPSLTYTWALSSVVYPHYEEILDDERFITHTVSCMVTNDSTRFLTYNGGISLSFKSEDWLFKSKLSSFAFEDSTSEDSLKTNLDDSEIFNARMYHTFYKDFNSHFDFLYSFSIEREKKVSPNFYYRISNMDVNNTFADTSLIENNDDVDKVYFLHSLGVSYRISPIIKLSGLGEYGQNQIVFLKKENSSKNKTDKNFRVETSCILNPEKRTGITETIGAFAKVEEYHFTEQFTQGKLPPPFWSRNFYSKFFGTWEINEVLFFEIFWKENYVDDGFWQWEKNGSPNEPDSVMVYQPTQKTLESSLKATSVFSYLDKYEIQIGNLLWYSWTKTWDGDDKRYNISDKFILSPYIKLDAHIFNTLLIRLDLKGILFMNTRKLPKLKSNNEFLEASAAIRVLF